MKLTKKIKNNKIKNTIVLSMDVCSLYPSLEKGKCKEIVEEIVGGSAIKMVNIDWKEVALYLLITKGKEEMTRWSCSYKKEQSCRK